MICFRVVFPASAQIRRCADTVVRSELFTCRKHVLALTYPGGADQKATGFCLSCGTSDPLSLTRISDVAIARSKLSKISDSALHPRFGVGSDQALNHRLLFPCPADEPDEPHSSCNSSPNRIQGTPVSGPNGLLADQLHPGQ